MLASLLQRSLLVNDLAMIFLPRTAARVAIRHGSRNQCRLFFATPSRTASIAFHSYPLPSSNTPTPPRNDDVPETSIAQPEPLPKVHETRPPSKQEQKQQQHHHQPAASTAQKATATPSSSQPAKTAPAINEAEAQKSKPRIAPTPRPRSKLRARKAAMTLTPSAVEQLRTLLDQPEPKLIKVGVRNRGCSGLAYHLEYVEKPGAFDEAVEQDGVKVLIDSKALFSIIGSEMDWAEDKLNQRFVFKNPNISTCDPPLFPGIPLLDLKRLLTDFCRGGMRLWRVLHGIDIAVPGRERDTQDVRLYAMHRNTMTFDVCIHNLPLRGRKGGL